RRPRRGPRHPAHGGGRDRGARAWHQPPPPRHQHRAPRGRGALPQGRLDRDPPLQRRSLRPALLRKAPLVAPPSGLLYSGANPVSRRTSPMASYQYVYHMDSVSKTYPGGKKVFENIRLNFLPGVKIGVVGVNGSGKSTLLRVMAGIDKDFSGEAWAAKGATVGYLPQEPQLDPALNVRGNVMEGVKAKQAKLDRYNELAMNYSDETAEEMARLQDEIDAENLWDLDSQIDVA